MSAPWFMLDGCGSGTTTAWTGPTAPSSVTVIKDAAGRYFASFVVETEPDALPRTDTVIGIDLGLAHFAVLSDGRKIVSPKFLRRLRELMADRRRYLEIQA